MLARRIALGIVLGGSIGFVYQKLVGCRTGTCPLTATPLRAIIYGAVMGLLFASTGCSRRDTRTPAFQPAIPAAKDPAMTSTTQVIHLTSGAFPAVQSQDKPVLMDFWAPWCGPCRTQGPILDQVAATIGTRAIVAKINVDEEPSLAVPFGVQAIPTLVIMKGGKVIQRYTGVTSTEVLVKALEAAGA